MQRAGDIGALQPGDEQPAAAADARTGDPRPRLDVVTSDAGLAARVRGHGAHVIGSRAFRDELEEPPVRWRHEHSTAAIGRPSRRATTGSLRAFACPSENEQQQDDDGDDERDDRDGPGGHSNAPLVLGAPWRRPTSLHYPRDTGHTPRIGIAHRPSCR